MKIINLELATKLKDLSGLRNLLVHAYGKINNKIVFENLKHNLKDFYKFVEAIQNFLDKE